MQHSVSVTCCALLVSSISLSWAADVPSGTVLAEKQELVRHIKDEPASLDPAKAVGLPEIQVIRDLFEGLVNQNEKGEIEPGVATQWKSNDNRIWTFTLRDNAQWADGTPVTDANPVALTFSEFMSLYASHPDAVMDSYFYYLTVQSGAVKKVEQPYWP